jgi:hypothetical protein
MITVERAVILMPGVHLEVSLAKLKSAAAQRGGSALNRPAQCRKPAATGQALPGAGNAEMSARA